MYPQTRYNETPTIGIPVLWLGQKIINYWIMNTHANNEKYKISLSVYNLLIHVIVSQIYHSVLSIQSSFDEYS